MGRLFAFGITAGIACTHLLSSLVPWQHLLGAGLVLLSAAVVTGLLTKIHLIKLVLALVAAFVLGMAWSSYRAQIRLDDQLAESLENFVTRLNIQITSMVQDDGLSMRFDANVLNERPAGVPARIQVNWPRATEVSYQTPDATADEVRPKVMKATPDLEPGQVWRVALLLKRPHGLMNPHGFDYESLMFQRGVRALGKVRGKPVLLAKPATLNWLIFVEKIRQKIRERMRVALEAARYGPVLIALAIGDQNSVSADDWRVFNLTGITHLVSISGSHVTMMAAVGAGLVLWLVKRIKLKDHSLCDFMPARKIATLCALILAWLYCLLAGWGVPAQRTFYMLCAMACFQLSNFPPSLARVLCIAAVAVSVIDPWSTITTGFWLSFAAVAVLFYLGANSGSGRSSSKDHGNKFRDTCKRGASFLYEACKLQWLISVALCPILIFLFQQFSASSLLANAVAIPTISLVVTPLALAGAVLVLVPGGSYLAYWCLKIAHHCFNWMMLPVQALADLEWLLFNFSAVPVWTVVLATVALALGLAPQGTPAKVAAWVCFLPLFLYKPPRPGLGDWTLIAVDVGQAGAVLIQTHRQNILFDTGLKMGNNDSAQRVLLPLLRALGITELDHLVVSHSDNDHAGGLVSLLKGMSVRRISSSFDLISYINKHDTKTTLSLDPDNIDLCRAEQMWRIDGVEFRFLHPDPARFARIQQNAVKANALSCVLYIQGAKHSALLSGDIGAAEERSIVERYAVQADVVIVPHHGSRTSSSWEFVQQVSAKHAIAQMGKHNRFNHPHPEVVTRWLSSGSNVWRTDRDGAVTAKSQGLSLFVSKSRQTNGRYWHHR